MKKSDIADSALPNPQYVEESKSNGESPRADNDPTKNAQQSRRTVGGVLAWFGCCSSRRESNVQYQSSRRKKQPILHSGGKWSEIRNLIAVRQELAEHAIFDSVAGLRLFDDAARMCESLTDDDIRFLSWYFHGGDARTLKIFTPTGEVDFLVRTRRLRTASAPSQKRWKQPWPRRETIGVVWRPRP